MDGGTRRFDGLWGAICASAATTASVDGDPEALVGALSGLIAVGASRPDVPAVSVADPPAPTDGRRLAAAIRVLPASAAGLVWFGGVLSDMRTVSDLWTGIAAADAAVTAAPVTDAIKRVRDGRIRGGVPRAGLCVPTVPLAIQADAARSRLLPALDAGHDPVAALAVAGLVVHVALRETPVSPRPSSDRP